MLNHAIETSPGGARHVYSSYNGDNFMSITIADCDDGSVAFYLFIFEKKIYIIV